MIPSSRPPTVDLDELLEEERDESVRATTGQWALVVIGGIAGIAGLLALLVAVAPTVIELVSWITPIQDAING